MPNDVASIAADNDTLEAIRSQHAVQAVAAQTSFESSQGHTCGCHDQGAAATELDARAIPHAIRHATIFGALGAVAPAGDLILVAPHDPLPLLHQIEQRWPSAFSIDYLERGPDAWRLRFTRAAAGRSPDGVRPAELNHPEPDDQRSRSMETTEVHAPRREPAEAEGPLDLQAAADELLADAGQLHAGRSARTLTPGPGAPLKQTLLALNAGQHLQDHLAPGPTTLLGIRGSAVLTHGEAAVTLTEGVWAPCPVGTHSLEAVTDAVVLLTVAASANPEPAA